MIALSPGVRVAGGAHPPPSEMKSSSSYSVFKICSPHQSVPLFLIGAPRLRKILDTPLLAYLAYECCFVSDTAYTIYVVTLFGCAEVKPLSFSFSEFQTSTEYRTTTSQSNNFLANSGESVSVSLEVSVSSCFHKKIFSQQNTSCKLLWVKIGKRFISHWHTLYHQKIVIKCLQPS